jgi:trans-aconitate methyltransferase
MLAALRTKVEKAGWADKVSTHETVASAEPDGPFDIVVASSVCGFLPDYPAVAKDLAGLLRPGGLFVQWDWEKDAAAAEPSGLSRDEITAALTGAGLVDVKVASCFKIGEEGGELMAPLMGSGRAPQG